jgi:hypothetical protein
MTVINRPGTRGFVKDEATSPGAVTFTGLCVGIANATATFEIAGTDTVEERIIDKIAEMAEEITVANGYRKTVARVYKQERSLENLWNRGLPAINVVNDGTVIYQNPINSESGRLIKEMPIVLEYVGVAAEKQDEYLADAKADIELRYFDDTPSATPKYNLEGEALVIIPVECTRFNVEDDKKKIGLAMLMNVHFRQSRRNPTLQY